MQIVALVRQKITKLTRTTLQALTVLDVHNQVVVGELMKRKCSSLQDFWYMAQLRYYLKQPQQTLFVRQLNARLPYCYEYLGNSGRLVITQLTDRCYRTLIGALDLTYGGAPEGKLTISSLLYSYTT